MAPMFGRVLAGFEVPPADTAAFEEALEGLGYPYQREAKNAAYELFLG
jgi:threonine dehydratase